MSEAMQAAPKPLSMLTTETLGEQVFQHAEERGHSAEGRAVADAVGTARTGALTRPPTTVGRAPSMPAQTMSTRADCKDVFAPAGDECRHADVGDEFDFVAHEACGDRGFFSYGQVAGACADYGNGSFAGNGGAWERVMARAVS